MKSQTLVLAAVAIAVLASAVYVEVAVQSTSSTTGSSSSSTTSTSTTKTSCTTTTTSTSSTTTGSSTSSAVTNGSFTYSPSSPVKIDSVKAIVTRGQDGATRVTFQVVFENAGGSNIYVYGGCGSGLSSSTIGGNSSIIQRINGGPLCDCALFMVALNHGQNHTSITPGCWSGYSYELVRPGNASVNLTLAWDSSSRSFQSTNSTSILAKFTFT